MAFRSRIFRIFSAFLVLNIVVEAIPTAPNDHVRLRRDIPQSPVKGLPGCSKSHQGQDDNEDPTWAVGKSAYTDGQGKYIGSDCVTGHNSNKCWTDYFLVGTTEGYLDYTRVSERQNCASSQACEAHIDQANQTCFTSGWSVSESISTGFSNELFSFGAEITVTESEEYQTCGTYTSGNGCTWEDQGCHSIIAAPKVTTIHGYKRRRCATPTSDSRANMPNTEKTGDDYTRGMMDFEIPIAGENALSCNGTCADYNLGAPEPIPDGDMLKPWPPKSLKF